MSEESSGGGGASGRPQVDGVEPWQPENELIAQRHQKAEALRAAGINPFANGFRVDRTAAEIFADHGEDATEALEAEPIRVRVAGRIRFRRLMGKASFLKIQDWSVRPGIKPDGIRGDERVPPSDDFLQVFVKADVVGAESYDLLKSQLDLGDFIGVEGRLMRTRTGELTVRADSLVLLSKALRPLPDKWHGLSDVEMRFRQRYVDFVMNERSREVLRLRAELVRLIRQFFHQRGYIEVETPILHPTPGGATARPFETFHKALGLDLFLRIAPELYLKRLLVAGFGRVFEIGRVFRNEGLSRQHNPEFTMCEFYQAYATFEDLIELTEALIPWLVKELHGGYQVEFDGQALDFSPPWPRRSVAGAVADVCGVEEADLVRRGALEDLARAHAIDPQGVGDGKLLMEIFDEVVQPTLIQPIFITHYPVEVSPLSRMNEDDPGVVDRFELFVCGNEIANAFSELNDPCDQHRRFEQQLVAKLQGDEEAHPMDEDYVRALEYGMPPAAGEGIGIDRLTMLLADAPSIREVIAFPLLRPESGDDSKDAGS